MNIFYRQAEIQDASKLVEIYNASFYSDYIKYGQCPAYGRTTQRMEESIRKFPKEIIIADGIEAGVLSYENQGNGIYYVGCLCVIPEYQGKGIGTVTFKHMLTTCKDWKEITLITPADKEENVKFYTEKCGFDIEGKEMDENVEVYRFIMRR